jgi:hypothetical protein
MSISTGRISLPRRVESLKRQYQGPISLELLDGKLSSFVAEGGQGAVFIDLENARPDMPPHSGLGSIVLYDGKSQPILDCSSLEGQVEQGAPVAGWSGPTVGNFAAKGLDSLGRMIVFRMVDVEDTSIIVEFAVADDSSFPSSIEALQWAMRS